MWQAANIQINDLIFIAEKAGSQILSIYYQENINWEVSFKSDSSPLTLADKVSNKTICDFLTEKYPQIPIISEENKSIDYEVRKVFPLFWLIDPLDGTKEFIKRNGEFTVNIALVENSKVVLGVVHVPCHQKTYFAQKNGGSFCINQGQKEAIKVLTFKSEDENLILVASRSHFNEETAAFVSKYKNPVLVSQGSSLKFMLIAEGKAHIYPRLGPTMEWDTAAAQIIVEESGGKVVSFIDDAQLIYNKQNLLNPYFYVTGNESSNIN